MKMERYDSLDDLNKGLTILKSQGRKILDIKIFSYTLVTEEGLPSNYPVFYVQHEEGIYVPK